MSLVSGLLAEGGPPDLTAQLCHCGVQAFAPLSADKMCVCVCVCVHAHTLSCVLTLCNPMNRSPPGSSVHGVSQARRRVGCQLLLQEVFSALGSTPLLLCLLRGRLILHLLRHQGSQRLEAASFSLPLVPPCGQQGLEHLCFLFCLHPWYTLNIQESHLLSLEYAAGTTPVL